MAKKKVFNAIGREIKGIFQRGRSPTLWLAFVSLLILAYTGSYIADEIKNAVQLGRQGEIDGGKFLLFIGHVALMWIGASLSIQTANRLFVPQTRRLRSQPPERREVLVFFLSEMKGTDQGKKEGWPTFGLELSDDLDLDLRRLADAKMAGKPFWIWEQPLRGIQYHVSGGGPLRRLVMVCSQESLPQIECFCGNVLRQYAVLQQVRFDVLLNERRGPKLVRWCESTAAEREGKGWDFEDFDELSDGLFELLADLNRSGIGDDQVVIDFTSGMKPNSVVAAAITLNRDIETQYVATKERPVTGEDGNKIWDYDVKGYDLVLARPLAN